MTMETCIFTYFRVGPAFELMNIGECNGTGVLVHLGSTTMHSYNPRLLSNCPLRDISYELVLTRNFVRVYFVLQGKQDFMEDSHLLSVYVVGNRICTRATFIDLSTG